MASIKLKYRLSSVKGKDGKLYFQIIHMRQIRHIYTDMRIAYNEWDTETASITMPSGTDTERVKYLTSAKATLKEWHSKLSSIIQQFDQKGLPYTVEDIVTAYNSPCSIIGLVTFTRKLIDDMRGIGKKLP